MLVAATLDSHKYKTHRDGCRRRLPELPAGGDINREFRQTRDNSKQLSDQVPPTHINI